MAKIIIIDGNNLIFRSHFGVKALKTSKNIPTNALYGSLKTFKKVLEKTSPSYVINCWDSGKKSFRSEIDKEYKSHRPPVSDDLKVQFPIVRQAFKHLGVPQIIAPEGYEGDDIIASLATSFSEAGHNVLIISSDRDFLQLLNDRIKMISFNDLNTILDENYVINKFQLRPNQLIHAKALCGEKSDNIPGIEGIGDKTSTSLIKEHENLENLINYLEKNPNHKHYRIYREKELALRCLELARIKTDLKIFEEISILPVERIEINSNDLMNFFKEYELREMINNFNQWYYIYNYIVEEEFVKS